MSYRYVSSFSLSYLLFAAAGLAAALSSAAVAQEAPETEPGPAELEPETIIVIGARVPQPADEVGSAVTLIEAGEIEARKETFALDVLRSVPGAAVSRTGAQGGLTQVRLRGAEANQTLVLIDGVEVADPVSGEFDFSDLLTSDISRIEVLRGEQSALWGSDAIGGVINVLTKEANGPPAVTGALSFGSFNTRRFQGSAAAGADRWSARLSGALLDTDGINVSRTGSETDGYRNGTIYFRGTAAPTETLSIEAAARYVDAVNEEDSGFPRPMDSNTVGRREQVSARSAATLSLLNGAWQQTFAASVNDVAARALSDDAQTTESHGRRFRLDWQSDLRFAVPALPDTEHRLTFYVEREALRFENASVFSSTPRNEADTVNWGYVAEYGLGWADRLFLTGSVRYEDNGDFEDAFTFRATSVVQFGDTRLHGRVGTGVQNPGFFDLFGFDPGFFLGNPDLEPEQSFGWDVGVERAFLDGRLRADVTWFRSDLEDEIVTVFLPPSPGLPGFPGGALTPVNADLDGEREGLEVTLAADLSENWSFYGAYTWLDATENGEEEVRRSPHTASLSSTLAFLGGQADATLTVDYVGEFRDFDFSTFPAARAELDSYVLVGFAARYRLKDGVELYLRGDNLLDEQYEEVLFFRAPGIAVTGGVTVSAELGR